jgi:hypothetical protein
MIGATCSKPSLNNWINTGLNSYLVNRNMLKIGAMSSIWYVHTRLKTTAERKHECARRIFTRWKSSCTGSYTCQLCGPHCIMYVLNNFGGRESEMLWRRNAFAQAPAPNEDFGFNPTEHSMNGGWQKEMPDPSRTSPKSHSAMQGHTESPRSWERHCDKFI